MTTTTEENARQKEEQNQKIAWVLKTLHCEGLEPHNRSLELMCELLDELDAIIDIGSENRRYDAESFAIHLRGKSGTRYRISVHYRARFARLIANRFDEIEFDDEDTIGVLLHPIRTMTDTEIHWHDPRDGNWESICIHGRRDETPKSWPVDLLVTTMLTLSDDLRQALELPMNTLRRELRSAYPVAWHNGQTPEEVTFADVTKCVTILEALEGAESRDEFDEIRALALEELFNEEAE